MLRRYFQALPAATEHPHKLSERIAKELLVSPLRRESAYYPNHGGCQVRSWIISRCLEGKDPSCVGTSLTCRVATHKRSLIVCLGHASVLTQPTLILSPAPSARADVAWDVGWTVPTD